MNTHPTESSPRDFFESLKSGTAARELVETYQHEREIMRRFHSEVFSLMAKRAFYVCARRIGIPVRKLEGHPTVVFDSELEMALLNIFCLMLDDQCGVTPRKTFVRAHAGDADPDIAAAVAQFDGYRYSWFLALETLPGTALLCEDLIAGGEVVVSDIHLSQSIAPGSVMMGGVLPVTGAAGPCHMTDGAWLPTGRPPREAIDYLIETTFENLHIHKTPPCTLKDSEAAAFAALSIRSGLDSGCGERVTYDPGDEGEDA